MVTKDNSWYWKARYSYYGRFKYTFGSYDLIQSSRNILDWGCSTGVVIEEILDNTPSKVYGIDLRLDEKNVSFLEKKFGERVKFIEGDGFTSLQEKGLDFDLVLAMNNLLYINTSHENWKQIFDSLNPLVKEGGKLVLAHTVAYLSKDKTDKSAYCIFKKEDGNLKGREYKPFNIIDNVKSVPAKENLDFIVENFF